MVLKSRARRYCVAALLIFSKTQPSSYSLTQSEPDAHGAQVRFYEALNLAETSQVALFAAWNVSDMAVPYRVAMLVSFFLNPHFDDERVRDKFGRPILTPLFR